MNIRHFSKSEDETAMLARNLAAELSPGDIIAFRGGLGAGKTAFVRGLAEGLGYEGETSSPTFSILHEYEGGRIPLYHFDLYRVSSFDDLLSCGFFDYVDLRGIIAAEWSENITPYLPENVITVSIQRGESDNERVIEIKRN